MKCKHHGPAAPGVWACPTCLVELREENQRLHAPLQGGMDNAALTDAWGRKVPGIIPTERDLTAFALGVEVGFAHARDLERQDWSRVHHVLAKHGVHPGRTDDKLADVIDRALSAHTGQA